MSQIRPRLWIIICASNTMKHGTFSLFSPCMPVLRPILVIMTRCRSSTRLSRVYGLFLVRMNHSADIGNTGRQPTPPDFILGYQQSKLRYWNQSQVLDVAQRFHDEQVNVSLIVVGKLNNAQTFIQSLTKINQISSPGSSKEIGMSFSP